MHVNPSKYKVFEDSFGYLVYLTNMQKYPVLFHENLCYEQ